MSSKLWGVMRGTCAQADDRRVTAGVQLHRNNCSVYAAQPPTAPHPPYRTPPGHGYSLQGPSLWKRENLAQVMLCHPLQYPPHLFSASLNFDIRTFHDCAITPMCIPFEIKQITDMLRVMDFITTHYFRRIDGHGADL